MKACCDVYALAGGAAGGADARETTPMAACLSDTYDMLGTVLSVPPA